VIGIVIVSHSTKLAEGVVELARNMGGPDLAIQAAGGLTTEDGALGTDPMLILNAIEQVYSEDGVLVLMDLGSAILSSEMALEMLPEEKRGKVVLCEAPIVEGAIAAAVQARIGGSIQQVINEARGALTPKSTHLNIIAPEISQTQENASDKNHLAIQLTVKNSLGLHARPAARFVQTAGKFPQEAILVSNLTTKTGQVNAKSINSVITLGVRQGHQIEVTASGPNARAALEAIKVLAENKFGDQEESALSGSTRSTSVLPSSGEVSALTGIAASTGIALGPAFLYRPAPPEIPQHQIENSKHEWERLLESIAKTREEIEADRKSAASRTNHNTAAIFEAHLMFLEDEALLSPTREKVFKEKQNAALAWQTSVVKISAGFRNLEDAYLQARGKDVEDVGRQVLLHLLGINHAKFVMDKPGILIAADLTPAETANFEPATVLGICTAAGGPTSHSAILARELGIPAVVGLGDKILALQDGQHIILDGESGKIFVDPESELVNQYSIRAEALQQTKNKARLDRAAPALTRDGKTVEIVANIGSVAGAQLAVESGAEGVGLFRTEFLFLNRTAAPGEEEQFQAYRATAKALDGRPLIIRTLDVGGDKSIPYLNMEPESNPFLGWRAIRLCLAQPELFKAQLRAILRVGAEFPVKVMFPMIATLDELRRAKSLIDEASRELASRNESHADKVDTGIMVEIPSVAQMAEEFAREVGFFSIGTNDLTQYTFAVDRTNPKVASLADACHPAVLRQIQRVIEAAHKNKIWVSVCGELAGDPDAIPILLGLGLDEFSMSSPVIPKAKEIIRAWTLSEAQELAVKTLALDSAEAVRKLVKGATLRIMSY
jgi:phosphoenolpyruvate-protein phosphotransferase/dihydroxyacetone kinase phosphotransfer subunit